jgi:hypothetical protein
MVVLPGELSRKARRTTFGEATGIGLAPRQMVRDNNVDRALRVLKKLMQREGTRSYA